MKRYLKPLYTGQPWADQLITYRSGKTEKKAGKGLFDLSRGCAGRSSIWPSCCPTPFKPPWSARWPTSPAPSDTSATDAGFCSRTNSFRPRRRGNSSPLPSSDITWAWPITWAARRGDFSLKLFVTESEHREGGEVLELSGLPRDVHRPAAAGKPPLMVAEPRPNSARRDAGHRNISPSWPTGSSKSCQPPSSSASARASGRSSKPSTAQCATPRSIYCPKARPSAP